MEGGGVGGVRVVEYSYLLLVSCSGPENSDRWKKQSVFLKSCTNHMTLFSDRVTFFADHVLKIEQRPIQFLTTVLQL